MSHREQEAAIHVSTQRKEREEKNPETQIFFQRIDGKLNTIQDSFFSSKLHCNVLQFNLLDCCPRCRLVYHVLCTTMFWNTSVFALEFISSATDFWGALAYRPWLLGQFAIIQLLLQCKEYILGKTCSIMNWQRSPLPISQILRCHNYSNICHWKVSNTNWINVQRVKPLGK